MTDVGLGELIVRMVFSLAIVLAIVLAAYALLRRRQGMGSGAMSSTRRSRGSGNVLRSSGRSSTRSGTGRPHAGRRGLRIVGRIGVSRTSSLIAVQFAERVFLVGASDQAGPNVLAEMSVDDWERATEAPEESVPLPARTATPGARPGLLDSLREATMRRG